MRFRMSFNGVILYYLKQKNMTRIIENVFVDWISLVSKDNTPAVTQAENKFALFKTVKKDKNKEKLEKILQNLS